MSDSSESNNLSENREGRNWKRGCLILILIVLPVVAAIVGGIFLLSADEEDPVTSPPHIIIPKVTTPTVDRYREAQARATQIAESKPSTPTPAPTQPSLSSHKMARIFFMNTFEDELGFNCNIDQSIPRMYCYSPAAVQDVMIALDGPSSDLDSATIMIWNPEIDTRQTVIHLGLFMNSAMPTWGKSLEWINDNVAIAKRGGRPSTRRNGAKVEMNWDEATLILKVSK